MKYWEFIAYNKKLTLKGQEERFKEGIYVMAEETKVSIAADNEKQALSKAKKMVKRKYYHLMRAWEVEEDNLENDMRMTQLELQSKLLKLVKN